MNKTRKRSIKVMEAVRSVKSQRLFLSLISCFFFLKRKPTLSFPFQHLCHWFFSIHLPWVSEIILFFCAFNYFIILRKKSPKWAQKRPQNGTKRPPDGPKWRSKPLLEFRLNFGSNLDDFGSPKGSQNGPHNQSKISFGTPGPPRGLQGAILEPFWGHFGHIQGPELKSEFS